jgi:hypothetical protein
MVGNTERLNRRGKHGSGLLHLDIHLGGKQANIVRNTIPEILVCMNPVPEVREVLVVLGAGERAPG